MKKNNFVTNILLAFVVFFVGQMIVNYFGYVGMWLIIVGVVIFYIVWFIMRKRAKRK